MAAAEELEMQLSADDAKKVGEVLPAAAERLLGAEQPTENVIGVGAGVKWKDGKPTGKPAIVVLVTQKLPEDQIPKGHMIEYPDSDYPTDVLAVGHVMAGGGAEMEVGIETLARRRRPAKGGYSVGHIKITAGTIGTCVYDTLPGAKARPPVHGIGMPPRYYILSNNHVLANVNAASPGDPILQPGPYDGGTYPADRIARLSRFIPIMLEPPVPRIFHRNLVDAAVAEGEFHDLDREVYWIGHTRGWRPRSGVKVGMIVQKTGRTTNYTVGRIVATGATIDVNYGGGRVGRFRDQIVTTPMSAGGDSGSLVTTLDDVAVGLLFAGSSRATILNQIENVRNLLRVEVGEEIL